MATSLKEHVDKSTQAADLFVAHYYSRYDSSRLELKNLYRDSSAILWNGNAFSGIQPFTEFLNKLAASVHSVDAYDCHPLPSQPLSIIVNVNGTVKYGVETKVRQFSQSFVLMSETNPNDPSNVTFWVWSDCFRFV
ncbi:NTF2- export protein 1 [Gryganskiella cystojenkinii]|nr:NTF2- export protein 1 [Gryganskiella cystojenkinii]